MIFGIPLELPHIKVKGETPEMSRTHKRLFLSLMAAVLLIPIGWAYSPAQTKQKPPAQQPEQEEPYTEEEYDAYEKAVNEPDLDKRASALVAFMEKYPKSKLQSYIVTAHQTLLFELQKSKNHQKLLTHAEQWLKYFPDDLRTVGFIADAALSLNQDQKFIEYAQRIYAAKPDKTLALALAQTYKKLGNEEKYLEWADKSSPNLAHRSRMEYVDKFTKEKDFQKAAQYAHAALKSIEQAQRPDDISETEWQKEVSLVRRNCDYIIGLNYYDKDRPAEAIKSLQRALVHDKRFDLAYYYIALSQQKLGYSQNNWDLLDEAVVTFAKVELLKGEASAQAKEQLEKLYKALHNNTLVGIERRYARAARELGINPGGNN